MDYRLRIPERVGSASGLMEDKRHGAQNAVKTFWLADIKYYDFGRFSPSYFLSYVSACKNYT